MLGAIVSIIPGVDQDGDYLLERSGKGASFTVVGVKHNGSRVCLGSSRDFSGHGGESLNGWAYRNKLPDDQIEVFRKRCSLFFVNTKCIMMFENEE